MSSRAHRIQHGELIEPYDWLATPAEPIDVRSSAGPATRVATPLASSASRPAVHSRTAGHPAEADEQRRCAEAERDAFTKGYAQGERAGAEASAKRADAMLRRLAQTVEELAALRSEIIHRTERQVVQLAMSIAKRLLGRELSLDRGLLAAMARVALDRLGEHASARIRLHPEDYAAVMAAQDAGWPNEQVQLVADPAVGRGGCLVESDFGLMDIGLDAQFAELTRTLFDDREATAETANVPHGLTVRR